MCYNPFQFNERKKDEYEILHNKNYSYDIFLWKLSTNIPISQNKQPLYRSWPYYSVIVKIYKKKLSANHAHPRQADACHIANIYMIW